MKSKSLGNKAINYVILTLLSLISLFPYIQYAFKQNDYKMILASFFSFIIPVLLYNLLNIKLYKYLIYSIPVFLILTIYTFHAFDFDTDVNVNTFEVFYNTNAGESKEFLELISMQSYIYILLQLIALFVAIYIAYKKDDTSKISKKVRIISGVLLLIILGDYAVKGSSRASFPFTFVDGGVTYSLGKYYESKHAKQKEGEKFYATRDTIFLKSKKETIVVVIGETLRRDKLQYYGYDKETTPYLNKENLTVFTDVISASNQTVNSLKRTFSSAEYNNLEGYNKFPSLIKSFREVGFKTYWVSNQKVFGFNDSEISYIAKESDKVVRLQKLRGYDEFLFNPYKEVLESKEDKKVIFIHLMGSHAVYEKRFPPSFKHFSKNKTESTKEELLNLYDDTVRYNDYILSYFLNELKKQAGESSFVMFSDHGESLFDSGKNICCHGSEKPSQSEYNIPFVMWFNNEFNKKNKHLVEQLNINKDKPVILSDFFHSLPSFYGIKSTKLDSKKNFLGKEYKTPRRFVLNSKRKLFDYNKLPKTTD